MTTNTDPVRALIGEMTDYLDQEVDPELDVIEQWRDRLESAIASAPPSAAVGVKRWPFVESPGEFTERLAAAMQELPLIGAVRHVLIENPPALAQQPAAIPRLANCGKYTATDNNGQHYYLNHANTWQTFQGQQPAAPSGEAVAYTRATGPQEDMPTLTPNEYAALRKAGMGEGYRPLVFGDAAIAAANGGGNE